MNRTPHHPPVCSRRTALAGLALALGGCAAGPRYRRPEVTTPAAWR
ncbi:MAG: hypothetical protein JNM26_18870, partial [Ideonella sp.]|nr:hypothetical protein [Ideonella sp.]